MYSIVVLALHTLRYQANLIRSDACIETAQKVFYYIHLSYAKNECYRILICNDLNDDRNGA